MDNNFSDLNRRAGVLMQSALRKYGKGEYQSGDKDRQEANRLYDEAAMMMNSEYGKMSILYGENRNFGIVYKVFDKNLKSLYEAKNTKAIGEIMLAIKRDPVLNAEYKSYKALLYPEDICEGTQYVKDVLSLFEAISEKDMREHNEKLIALFRKHGLDEAVEVSDEEMELFEALEYVTLNKMGLDNVGKYGKCVKTLSENVERIARERANEQNDTVDAIYESMCADIETYAGNNLNEAELKLLKSLGEGIDRRKEVFEDTKKKAVETLKEAIGKVDGENRDKLVSVCEDIEKREFNDRRSVADIAEMMEIRQTLTE